MLTAQAPVYKRLPLKRLKNIRDLGGYVTLDGKITRYHVYIRSEVPRDLPEEDIQFLRDYGVKESLDFRSVKEGTIRPSSLSALPDIKYQLFPMNSLIATMGATGEDMSSVVFTNWGDSYCRMIETEREWCKNIVEALAAAEPCCHYHCTTGKDRTGLATMFLLSIARVPEEDIVADYSISQSYLNEKYKTMRGLDCISGGDIHHPVFQTSSYNMEQVIHYIKDKFGSVEQYLLECGVSEQCFTAIRNKFVEG